MELKYSEKFSVFYHDIFSYPLTKKEILKWTPSVKNNKNISCSFKDGFYFIKGRNLVIKKRLLNEKYSKQKIQIVKRVVKLLSKIRYVKMIGLTGALAMNNAGKFSDIDLLIVTKSGNLWTTRLLVYLLITTSGFKIRNPKDKNEKDKLCLNMWMDESDLVWSKNDRNIYTAHEILQIIPLLDRDKTYERLIDKNRWAIKFWPNVLKIKDINITKNIKREIKPNIIERLLFKLQYLYMKNKITREIVKNNRAVFHPNDWGKKIDELLNE